MVSEAGAGASPALMEAETKVVESALNPMEE